MPVPAPAQRTDGPSPRDGARPGLAAWSARIAGSRPFEVTIVVLIMANGIVLGVETYPDFGAAGPVLRWTEWVFRLVFIVEIAIRVLAYGRRPQDFFRHGWNVFDFLVTVAIFVPGLHGDSAVLRFVRVARVLRLVRFSPGLQIIVAALWRSLPGVAGFLALAAVTLYVYVYVYVYGMAGWLIFSQHYPEQYACCRPGLS
ncbi:ion transporter [Micromonospora sp. CPCC 206060]|uniref:ion transporter n=1 Tax=Micromonospora sp. CPCC 206060 TaxID=3122406 RepID=UPI002FF3A982